MYVESRKARFGVKGRNEHSNYIPSDFFSYLRMKDNDWTQADTLPLDTRDLGYRTHRSTLVVTRLILDNNPPNRPGRRRGRIPLRESMAITPKTGSRPTIFSNGTGTNHLHARVHSWRTHVQGAKIIQRTKSPMTTQTRIWTNHENYSDNGSRSFQIPEIPR